MPLLQIHSVHDFGDDAMADLRRRIEGVAELTHGPDADDPERVDVLIAGRPERRHMEAMTGLRAMVIPWAGIGRPTRDLVAEFPGVELRNIHHNAGPTAEHAIGLLLAAARRVVPRDRKMRAHDWKDRGRGQPAVYLRGERAVVLGFGSIGRYVAEGLRGLGMTVTGVRGSAVPGEVHDGIPVFGPHELRSILPGARALVICVPLNDTTEGMIGADELALLGSQSVVVNVARGPVVDPQALYEALRSGAIHGAGLDVWWQYPRPDDETSPPAEQPFEELDNVVMTPHCAGHCDATEALRMEALGDLIHELAGA